MQGPRERTERKKLKSNLFKKRWRREKRLTLVAILAIVGVGTMLPQFLHPGSTRGFSKDTDSSPAF